MKSKVMSHSYRRARVCGDLISVCTSPNPPPALGWAILNKHTTSSYQRPIHPITSRQILSKTQVMLLFQLRSHASCIRISRHIRRRINKEKKEVRRNLMQDIRKSQTPLILLKGFLVEVHLLSAKCMREKGEPLSKHWGVGMRNRNQDQKQSRPGYVSTFFGMSIPQWV